MKGIKAIIFDCDGTVLDSERIFINTWNIIGRPMGYDIPYEVLFDNRGKSKAYGRQNLLNAMGEDFPIDVIEAERKILNEKMFLEAENIVKPGIRELIVWMKEHQILSGVASARTRRETAEHLQHAGVYEGFDVVLGGDMVERNKPEPDLFLKVAELLGVKPTECIVIGDTVSDMRAAKAANMKAAFIEDMIPVDDEVMMLADVLLSRIDMIIPMIEGQKEEKWEISVQTARWLDEQKPEESMHYIKECGFDGVDFNMNSLFRATYDEEKLTSFFDKSIPELVREYTPLKVAAKEHGVTFCQSHGILVLYYKDDETKTDYLMKVTEKMIAICQYLECKAIVIHPWMGAQFGAGKEEEYATNMGMYRRLMPIAKKYGVKICLENLWEKHGEKYVDVPCTNVREACDYIDTLNKEAGEDVFGFCLDIGHTKFYNIDIYEYMQTLGKRLTVLHLHENDGTSDSHMIPYTQVDAEGPSKCIDWESVLKGLYDIGYEGSLSFETCTAIVNLVPEMKTLALNHIAEIGKWFRKRLDAPEWVVHTEV